MTLNPLPIFPAASGYVLRLHRDARPADGLLIGRIQHVTTGEYADFANGAELVEWLIQHGRDLGARVNQPEQDCP